jgi:2-phospho-L-lactate guanylyltransferase
VSTDWAVVVPVKGTPAAKSRLGASSRLALAIALDTVEAAVGAARVVVVTPPAGFDPFTRLGAAVVADAGGGLAGAIGTALGAVGDGPVAVLLGDLPALTSAELAAALTEASRHPLAFVPDADGVGTVLLTALDGAAHRPAFGGASRAAHLAAGYVELDVPVESGLRRDVDTAAQLAGLADEGRLGPRTAAAVAAQSKSATASAAS